MAIDASRAQLIHIETDRRLGHEWDEWDGGPLPNGGDFSAPPGLFFRYAALTLVVLCAAAAGVLFLLSPRLAAVAPARSEEHTSELQSRLHLVCRLLLEKKKPIRSTLVYHQKLPGHMAHTIPYALNS